MNCDDVQALIDSCAGDELDLPNALEIARHLQACEACSRFQANFETVRSALRQDTFVLRTSPDLRTRVRKALRVADRAEKGHRWFGWRWLPTAAAAALLLFTVSFTYWTGARSTEKLLAQEIVSSHVRSLMADHLTDVTSSDRHTVKPWFSGKLDFSPTVVDLAEQGFPLLGGRIDYVNNRAVAVLVYGSQRHFINLLVWPNEPTSSLAGVVREKHLMTDHGYHLAHWTQGGMTYWAVSDLNEIELHRFAGLIQTQTR